MQNFTFWKNENGESEFLWPKQQRDMLKYSLNSNIVVPSAIQFNFAVDTEKMEKAVQAAFDSYDVIRSISSIHDGKYYYKIVDNYKYKLDYYEAVGNDYEERFENALMKIDEKASLPLDFFNELSVKIGLIKVTDELYIFYFIGHPLVADGSAGMVIVDKIMSVYFDKPKMFPDGIQYYEFSKRCLEYESSEKGIKDRKYWDDELEGYKPYDVEKWYEGRKAEVTEYQQMLDYELFKKVASMKKTSIYNIALLGIHIAAHISLGITDTTVVVPSACRIKKDEMYTVGSLVRNTPHRMIFGREEKLSDLLQISIKKVSKNLIHHHAGTLEPSCQLTLSYNNFRGGLVPEYKIITTKVGNNTRVTSDQIVTLVELDNKLSLNFCFDHRISYEALCFFKETVQLTAKMLEEDPDITVGEMAKILGR